MFNLHWHECSVSILVLLQPIMEQRLHFRYSYINCLLIDASFQNIFRLFQSFLILSFILCIILYCLKIKLPITYRVLSGIQAMSILIYSKTMYFDYEDFFVLKFFNLLSGPFIVQYRLENISTNHALQTYLLLGFFLFLLFVLYFPSKTFKTKNIKQEQSYFQYVKSNILEYLQNFYYFGGKMMFFYIGAFTQSKSLEMISIVHLCIFSVLILVTIGRLVHEYHNNSLSQQIYQGPLYLYCMLSNSAMIGLSLVSTKQMLILIYCLPLGLLLLILILNKQFKIVQKNTLKFFCIQILMVGLSICIILFSDQIKTIILLITSIITSLIIVVELSSIYYGGIDLLTHITPKSSNKIHPQISQSHKDIDVENQSKKNKQDNSSLIERNKKKGKYF